MNAAPIQIRNTGPLGWISKDDEVVFQTQKAHDYGIVGLGKYAESMT
jgi:hypothetical protein